MNQPTRAEHLAWCKTRALEYVDQGDSANGLASMFSDLAKHPETEGHVAIEMGFRLMLVGLLDRSDEARNFINGFN